MIKRAKTELKRWIGYDKVQQEIWRKRNAFLNTPYENGYVFTEGAPTVAIVYDVSQEHQFYIKACVDLKMNYTVIDIRTPDWMEIVQKSGCQVFLFWPNIYKPIQKQFLDERLYTMEHYLNVKVFPSSDLLWIYESKRRTLDWLNAQKLPHPETYIFFDEKQAMAFIKQSSFPIVCKTDQGAAASGVFILRTPGQAMKMVKQAFGKGILLKNRGFNDRHQGYIIFQEYLEDCKEWRIIRVGESFFCRYKIKVGDFHSGSGDIIWAKAPEMLLNYTKAISEKFRIPNINVDFFETKNGEYLINEIHALWGGKVIHDDKLEGRYLFDDQSKTWNFEKGDFFKNRCANLRLDWIAKYLLP